MSNALELYSKRKFTHDITVDNQHLSSCLTNSSFKPEDVAFTVHLPFEYLRSCCKAKQTSLAEWSYVQILNAFISEKYAIKIKEDSLRVEELLRVSCSAAARQLAGKSGRHGQNLLKKVKSIAVQKNELITTASVISLQNEVSRLEKTNSSILTQNSRLQVKYEEASSLVNKLQPRFEKASSDIEKLKQENEYLHNLIEKISPQRKFEDKGKQICDVGIRQQERKLRTLETRVEQALWFTESFGLHLETLKLVDDFGKPYSLSFEEKGNKKAYKDLPIEQQQIIQQYLFLMDKFCIGEATYHELTCCPGADQLPKSYLIRQCKEELNKLFYIERTPGEASGAALNFIDELRHVIEKMVSTIKYISTCLN